MVQQTRFKCLYWSRHQQTSLQLTVDASLHFTMQRERIPDIKDIVAGPLTSMLDGPLIQRNAKLTCVEGGSRHQLARLLEIELQSFIYLVWCTPLLANAL